MGGRLLLALLLPFCTATIGRAEDPAPPVAPPTPAEVEKAIESGKAWLAQQYAAGFNDAKPHDVGELVMLTLAHTGGNMSDKLFALGVEFLAKTEPRFTYRTALQAMALSEINPRLYQQQLAHCAQWLVDRCRSDSRIPRSETSDLLRTRSVTWRGSSQWRPEFVCVTCCLHDR